MGKPTDPTQLQSLPSIGPSLARDLVDLGLHAPADLRGRDPEQMFADLCRLRGEKIDRCVLYSFRCAVYAATSKDLDPERKKWWNWKD
ncbi:MAG: helix-hairpin-helix domain-containing protein [Gammaproteobacteria bacterium]